MIFDRPLYVARIHKARSGFLGEMVTLELAERVALITRKFAHAVVIAPDPHPIAAMLKTTGTASQVAEHELSTSDNLGLGTQSCDAIFSILDLHAVNDVPGQLAQMARALRPDGLFLACLFAGDSLTELRQSWLAAESELRGGATPRVAPMISMRELGALLQRAGLALPVADLDRTMVRYANALSLIREIHDLGMSNILTARSRTPVSKRLLIAAARHYGAHFSDPDTRIRATTELAWLTAWSPHESQQQPLKPGSAKMRLADALKVNRSNAE